MRINEDDDSINEKQKIVNDAVLEYNTRKLFFFTSMEDHFQLHTPSSKSGAKMFALFFLSLIGLFVLLFLWKLVSTIWIVRYGDEAEKQTLEEKINPNFTPSPEMALRYRTKSSKLDASKLQTNYSPKVGSSTAPVKIVAFIDFECPYTQSSYPALKEMLAQHEGIVQLSVRNFPLTPIHPQAMPLAIAASCAGEQNKFFAFADMIFTTKKYDSVSLNEFAKNLGLNINKFTSCITRNTHQNEINNDIQEGVDLGIRGTPTFIINDKKVEGSVDKATWDQILVRALQQQK